MPTLRNGEKISWKEVLPRWKEGVNNITPYQQTITTIVGQIIVFFGIIWGIVVSFIIKQWWLTVVLVGSIVISFSSFIATIQKYISLKKLNDMLKGGQDE